jgi:hypothetical protein
VNAPCFSILVWTDAQTPRHSYTLEVLLSHTTGLTFSITTDEKHWRDWAGIKLAYCRECPKDLPHKALWLQATGLLSEKGIQAPRPKVEIYGALPGFFPAADPRSCLPVDALALIFWLVSRYEEYQDFMPDPHGRFTAQQSLAGQAGFLNRPLADEWALQLRKVLLDNMYAETPPLARYRFFPTYDIDLIFAYRAKGFSRYWGRTLLDIRNGDWPALRDRVRVAVGRQRDPFDTFDALLDAHANEPAVFFWLLANYGPHDINNRVGHPAVQARIRQVAAQQCVGAHPSYRAFSDDAALDLELSRLAEFSGQTPSRSRQHYLRLRFPDTYRRLIARGIAEEYSMGFAEQVGFRAGTAHPFLWYDLENEAATPLRVVPFMAMDVTLHTYCRLSPEEALQQTAALVAHTRAVGGQFVSLWHNNSLSETGAWKGWKSVWENTLLLARPQ